MECRISGGTLYMSKRFFAKESLKPGSYLRKIIGIDNPKSQKVKQIIKNGDQVIIKYQSTDKVILEDDFTTFFDEAKEAYGSEISGSLVLYMDIDFEDFQIKIEFG